MATAGRFIRAVFGITDLETMGSAYPPPLSSRSLMARVEKDVVTLYKKWDERIAAFENIPNSEMLDWVKNHSLPLIVLSICQRLGQVYTRSQGRPGCSWRSHCLDLGLRGRRTYKLGED